MGNLYIVEDNFLHREHLETNIRQALQEQHLDYKITAVDNLNLFPKQLSNENINDTDIYFLDIELNSLFNGIDIASFIRKYNNKCFLIFVTSNTRMALEAINRQLNPFSYLIKDDNDILSIDAQIKVILKKIQHTLIADSTASEKILIKSGQLLQFFAVADVNFIETVPNNRYSIFIKTKNDEIFINATLSSVKKNLTSPCLFKELKAYIINTSNIYEISRSESSITFTNGDSLILSPRMIDKLKHYIAQNQASPPL
ncbi:LytR/AlgR family response regulator transcription factor [Listeria booriae]|uniref:LytR/AlgR family response regulator transcription factor n=1 Tax=Listeria booriae TaxID=1552123 RepID=UPI0016239810|nr:LytTR family DNA-binding domain-containing protein [Listeria booriae]MBC2149687.1 response regulator transcription factor [Listeria booriae]